MNWGGLYEDKNYDIHRGSDHQYSYQKTNEDMYEYIGQSDGLHALCRERWQEIHHGTQNSD